MQVKSPGNPCPGLIHQRGHTETIWNNCQKATFLRIAAAKARKSTSEGPQMQRGWVPRIELLFTADPRTTQLCGEPKMRPVMNMIHVQFRSMHTLYMHIRRSHHSPIHKPNDRFCNNYAQI